MTAIIWTLIGILFAWLLVLLILVGALIDMSNKTDARVEHEIEMLKTLHDLQGRVDKLEELSRTEVKK